LTDELTLKQYVLCVPQLCGLFLSGRSSMTVYHQDLAKLVLMKVSTSHGFTWTSNSLLQVSFDVYCTLLLHLNSHTICPK